MPQKDGRYKIKNSVINLTLISANYHKNFELYINNDNDETQLYYFKFKSSQISDAIIVLRSVDWLSPALDEYFYFGIFME
ncbi:hypothetical protein CS542_09445 [Pedobacter sp. IW39]|nr:hypothetical protein CS542_09445 [Pedobacter sp. IW39]